MSKYLLSRREFATRCAATLSLPAIGALLAVQGSARVFAATGAGTQVATQVSGRTAKLPDGTVVSAVGQGAWHLGQGRHPDAVEEEAVRAGLSLGMTLIDTSGNYGNGRSEQFLSHVIAGQRDRIFLVSKVEPHDVVLSSCAATRHLRSFARASSLAQPNGRDAFESVPSAAEVESVHRSGLSATTELTLTITSSLGNMAM